MPKDLEWLEQQLSSAYDIKTQRLGMGAGWDREGKVLNRVVRCNDRGWKLEADPWYAELIIEQLGMMDAKAAATPSIDGPEELYKY